MGASKQLRKEGEEINQGDGENKKSKLRLPSSSAKRLFVTPEKNIPGDSIREGKEKKLNPLWGNHSNQKGLRHYMKSTVCFTNKVLERQNMQERKNGEKLIMAPGNKIIGNSGSEGKEKRFNFLRGNHSNQK